MRGLAPSSNSPPTYIPFYKVMGRVSSAQKPFPAQTAFALGACRQIQTGIIDKNRKRFQHGRRHSAGQFSDSKRKSRFRRASAPDDPRRCHHHRYRLHEVKTALALGNTSFHFMVNKHPYLSDNQVIATSDKEEIYWITVDSAQKKWSFRRRKTGRFGAEK